MSITPDQNKLICEVIADLVKQSGFVGPTDDKTRTAIAATRRVLVDSFSAVNAETAPCSGDVWKASR
jgi:hypothetical protein